MSRLQPPCTSSSYSSDSSQYSFNSSSHSSESNQYSFSSSSQSSDSTPQKSDSMPACPDTMHSPGTENFHPYESSFGSFLFHGSQPVLLENIKPTPERLQQECVYDEDTGKLISDRHPYGGIAGSPNAYDGHGSIFDSDTWDDKLNHLSCKDPGGICENGREAFADSMEMQFDKGEYQIGKDQVQMGEYLSRELNDFFNR